MTDHLIHIGFPKTGSNFLRYWFELHPQIAFHPERIAGFEDIYAVVHAAADMANAVDVPHLRVTSAEAITQPHRSFGLRRTDMEQLAAQPLVPSQAAACAMLANLFPSAFILIVTRSYAASLLSGYSQYVREGGHDSFADYRGAALEKYPWNYDEVIAMYQAAFDPRRVIILPYELLRDDPASFLEAIATPFDLPHIAPALRRENPSLSGRELAWYPALSRKLRLLPLSPRLARICAGAFARLSLKNRLRWAIAALQRVKPLRPVTLATVDSEQLRLKIKPAEFLRNIPHYRPYLEEYFLS